MFSGAHDAVPAPRRHDPFRPVHGQTREHGHARPLQALAGRRSVRELRQGGARTGDLHLRVLPGESRPYPEGGESHRRTVPRRTARHDGRTAQAPRRRTENGKRGARRRARQAGIPGRHPRAAALRTHRPLRLVRSRGHRIRYLRRDAAGDLGAVLASADRPRTHPLSGEPPGLPRLRACETLPSYEGGQKRRKEGVGSKEIFRREEDGQAPAKKTAKPATKKSVAKNAVSPARAAKKTTSKSGRKS